MPVPGLPTGSRCPPGPDPVPPGPPGRSGRTLPPSQGGETPDKGSGPHLLEVLPGHAARHCALPFATSPPNLLRELLSPSAGKEPAPCPPSAPFFCLKRGGAGLRQGRRSRGARGCGGLRISGFWGLGVPRHGRRRRCRSRSSLGAGRAAPALPPHFPGNFLFRS